MKDCFEFTLGLFNWEKLPPLWATKTHESNLYQLFVFKFLQRQALLLVWSVTHNRTLYSANRTGSSPPSVNDILQ